ncbi:hypothetical protein HMPREF9078_00442 [Capnocytophaga sp. oral taxon 380 str. F0488]|nr:hypothetical protein HMPREF9078_00442 [Capnocytophaga sp. oral taxon 380 str. F0488]
MVCLFFVLSSSFIYLPVRLASAFVRLLFVFCSAFVRLLFVFCSSFLRLFFVFSSSFVYLPVRLAPPSFSEKLQPTSLSFLQGVALILFKFCLISEAQPHSSNSSLLPIY